MSVLNRPRIEAYIGGTGSGKGVSINERLRDLKPPRLLIWDPRNEYGKLAPAAPTLPHLVGAFKHAKGGPVRQRYVAGESIKLADAFDAVCRLAFAAENLVLLAEELSDVTTASHAPASWKRVITQGRHAGLHVIGAAQRPALIDKTFLGNCTYIRCFALRYHEDRQAMAKALDVPLQDVNALQTTETEKGAWTHVHIQYLERDFRAGMLQGGEYRLKKPADKG